MSKLMNFDNGRNRFLIFSIIILLVNSIVSLGACLYLPAMPIIAKSMNIGEADIGKTITFYFLAFSLFSFISGFLSDIYGRKIVISYGIIFYIIGSLMCGLASSLNLLIVGRIVQAVGASMIPGTLTAMIRDVGSDIQVISLLGWISVVSSIFLVGAPVLGGIITQNFGWRSNFWFLMIFSFFILFFSYFYLKETLQKKGKLKLRYIFEKYINMLTNPYYILVLSPLIICFAIQGCYFTSAPFIFIKKFMLSPVEFGLSNIVIVFGLFAGRFFSVYFTKLFSNRVAYMLGALTILISGAIFVTTLLYNNGSLFFTLIGLGVFSTGFGCLSPIAMQSSITAFKEYSGMAGALQGSLILIFSTIGSAITVYLSKNFHKFNMFEIFVYIVLFFSILVFIFSIKFSKYILYQSK